MGGVFHGELGDSQDRGGLNFHDSQLGQEAMILKSMLGKEGR